MHGQNKVSGVILAGGLARRMNHQDKGLIPFNGQPLITYALTAMKPVVDEVMISANRNLEDYRQFAYPVITDNNTDFDGPLAGILAAMHTAKHPVLLITPCDSPLIKAEHLRRLLSALNDNTDIAAAFDGERLHPVFAALKTNLQRDLQTYLHSGQRKLQTWFARHSLVKVDFTDCPEIFANINTPEELQALQQAKHSLLS